MDTNPLVIKATPPSQTGLKERSVNMVQLKSLLENIKIKNDPTWVSKIKEKVNILILAGYAKQIIRFKYKLENEFKIDSNISFDTLAELLEVKSVQNPTDMSFEAQIKLLEQEQISQQVYPKELLGLKHPSLSYTRTKQSTPFKITKTKIFNTSIPIIQNDSTSLDSTQ